MKTTTLPNDTSTELNPQTKKENSSPFNSVVNRRSFLRKSVVAGATATVGAGILANGVSAFGQSNKGPAITAGDIAILRFLAAAELLETDLWQQYTELGGTQDGEEQGVGGGSPAYTTALQILDGDMPQYIHDNTDDEVSHNQFINAYLVSKGADPVDLDAFRNLPSSQATGAKSIGRLTNLTQLTVDTSFWTRYRSSTQNPDLDKVKFPQAVTIVNRTAIPRTDDDLMGPATTAPFNVPDHLKAIAFTAGFHFCAIEQGGSSLYPSLAQRVTNLEVLQIVLAIGPTETSHFQTWHDKAGNAVALDKDGNAVSLTDVDPVTGASVTFPDLRNDIPQPESLQSNLIMPEPTDFLSHKLPPCSVIRPIRTNGVAMGAVKGLRDSGLFMGQSPDFFRAIHKLAQEADAAQRGI